MRSAGLLVVLAGCGFHGSGPAPDQPPADASAPDSSVVVQDAGPAPDAIRSAFCSATGMVACYEFEGNAGDGSGNLLDATTTNVSFPPGQVGMAMQVGAGSTATAKASILVNVDMVTIEAWIRPTQRPGEGKQFDILDVDQQYAFTVNSDGALACDLHGLGNFSSNLSVPVNQWTHVACTYDGTTAARIYINGSVAGSNGGSGTLTKGGHAMGVAQNYPSGSQLVGLIDQLRLLNVARTPVEICADAGKLICL